MLSLSCINHEYNHECCVNINVGLSVDDKILETDIYIYLYMISVTARAIMKTAEKLHLPKYYKTCLTIYKLIIIQQIIIRLETTGWILLLRIYWCDSL